MQSNESRKAASDQFRQRHIDSTLKKLLNRYEQAQTICTDSRPAESSHEQETSGAVAE